jgi:hypothetical protein
VHTYLEGFMTKRVRVELVAIQCKDVGGDPGGELEFYGEPHAKRTFVNEIGQTVETLNHVFWSRPEDEPLELTELSLRAPEPGKGVVEINMEPGDTLSFGGYLTEEDNWPNPDDYMGHQYGVMTYDALHSGPHNLQLGEGDQYAEARFRTTVL